MTAVLRKGPKPGLSVCLHNWAAPGHQGLILTSRSPRELSESCSTAENPSVPFPCLLPYSSPGANCLFIYRLIDWLPSCRKDKEG